MTGRSGTPTTGELAIPIARPAIGEAERAAALRPLATGQLVQGREVASFEAELARAIGALHVVAVSSGTAAIALALRALGIGAGDEVVTASYSFVATANAVAWVGALPVFADVELATGNLAVDSVAGAIGPRTKAILAVHQFGWPCDTAALAALARERGVCLVEDAACAIGASILDAGTWRPIGTPVGTAATFSFHPRKIVATGEGGAVATRDPALAARVAALRQHGSPSPGGPCEIVGGNYRLNEIAAAIGRAQLARLDAFVAERRARCDRYDDAFAGARGLVVPVPPAWARRNGQTYWVRLEDGARRDAAMRHLASLGISARGGAGLAHREPAYAAAGSCRRADSLAASESLFATTLALPIYNGMTDHEQERVVEAVRAAAREGR